MRPLFFVLVLLAARAHAGSALVVLPLAGDDEDLTADLRTAVATVPALEALRGPAATLAVQSGSTTNEALAAARALGLACTLSSPSCMTELGGLASGDLVIGGTLEQVQDGAMVSLRLIEVRSKHERSAAVLLIPRGAARARQLRLLAVRLLAPKSERGGLVVRVRPPGASVQVDGDARGSTPFREPIALSPGRHDVWIAMPGYMSANQSVDVEFDQTATLDVELVRDDTHSMWSKPVYLKAPREQPLDPDVEDVPEGRVAITLMQAPNVEPNVTTVVARALATEIAKLEAVEVIRLEEVPSLLGDDTLLMAGCTEPGCNHLVATRLAVETLVQVEIGDGNIAIRRVDGTTGNRLMEYSRGVNALDEETLLAAVGPGVQRIFADRKLRAGEQRGYSVDGYATPKSGLPPWVFYSSLAATGVAAGTAGALLLWSSTLPEGSAAQRDLELPVWIAAGAAAGFLITDVITAFVTDW